MYNNDYYCYTAGQVNIQVKFYYTCMCARAQLKQEYIRAVIAWYSYLYEYGQ